MLFQKQLPARLDNHTKWRWFAAFLYSAIFFYTGNSHTFSYHSNSYGEVKNILLQHVAPPYIVDDYSSRSPASKYHIKCSAQDLRLSFIKISRDCCHLILVMSVLVVLADIFRICPCFLIHPPYLLRYHLIFFPKVLHSKGERGSWDRKLIFIGHKILEWLRLEETINII